MKKALVIVASTRASQGIYEDKSGPIAVEFLRSKGYDTPDPIVVADKDIDEAVTRALANKPQVLLTSGGTGVTDDDRTVESVDKHIERTMPGIIHAFYEEGRAKTPHAILSRAVAGVAGDTFVMTLPGSRGGVKDGCAVLAPVIDHIVEMIEGKHVH